MDEVDSDLVLARVLRQLVHQPSHACHRLLVGLSLLLASHASLLGFVALVKFAAPALLKGEQEVADDIAVTVGVIVFAELMNSLLNNR